MKRSDDRQYNCTCCCLKKKRNIGRRTAHTLIMLTALRCSSAFLQHPVASKRPLTGTLCATDSRRLRFEGQCAVTDLFSEFAYYIKSKSYAESQYAISGANSAVATIEHHQEHVLSATGGGREERRSVSSTSGSSSMYQRRNYASSSNLPAMTKSDASVAAVTARPPMYGPPLTLTDDEALLFQLLKEVRANMGLSTTLRVAGGWVRDKLLATNEYQAYHKVFQVGSNDERLTSKFRRHVDPAKRPGSKGLGFTGSAGKPVDIDIALDDMLGREYADYLNDYLSSKGEDTVTVGMVLKNPEKSKHLETATMKVGSFWIDFVNLRAEEYTQESRIPDLMRIGTPSEDAFRRDLTINALFYNINTGHVEDWTGRGLTDLQKGVVATPLPPLTTLLDDPLRVLRSIRFAARLRFIMDQELANAAKDDRVRHALAQKVSRERVGAELDLMLRSPDPVGAMRLLINLNLAATVLPMNRYVTRDVHTGPIFQRCLRLLSTTHDYLADCRWSPPLWCQNMKQTYGEDELSLKDDDQKRRLLWYASFLKPLHDVTASVVEKEKGSVRSRKKTSKSTLFNLLADDLKRPTREAEIVELIMETADEFTQIIESGHYVSSIMILLSDIQVVRQMVNGDSCEELLHCSMNGRPIDSTTEDDPVWQHAMEFRQLCAPLLRKVGSYWRIALLLAVSEQLAAVEVDGLEYAIEGDHINESQEELREGIIEKYDAFATALQEVGLIGIQNEKPLLCGDSIKRILTKIPRGPAFRQVMDEQMRWMTGHPGSHVKSLAEHLKRSFPEYV
ncbi:hypothetical protein MPSEU_000890300 [Mayamaea pseudoterrestris]|nr:hypothetical protein MPSEU_000890300 [Mayamaea pseudoterrestris]